MNMPETFSANDEQSSRLTRSRCTGECPSNCLDHKQRHKRISSRLTTARVIKDEAFESRNHHVSSYSSTSTISQSSNSKPATLNNTNTKLKTKPTSLAELSEDEDFVPEDLTGDGDEEEITLIRRTNNVIKTSIESSSRGMRSVHRNLTRGYKLPLITALIIIPLLITRFFFRNDDGSPISSAPNIYQQSSLSGETFIRCNATSICPSYQEVQLLNTRLDSLERLLFNLKESQTFLMKKTSENAISYDQEMRFLRDEQRDKLSEMESIITSLSQSVSEINELKEKLQVQIEKPTQVQVSPNCSNTPSSEEIKSMIRNALHVYDADKTGMADYALESSGGSVISTRCSETYEPYIAKYSVWGIPVWYTSNSPRVVIQNSMSPGECWAFVGSTGRLVIKLSALIQPTLFHYEHISKVLSREGGIHSAPKDFQVLGLEDEQDTKGVLLGNYVYLDNDVPLQRFEVQTNKGRVFQFIELIVLSNHGHPDYTCLYRFRVHGKRV